MLEIFVIIIGIIAIYTYILIKKIITKVDFFEKHYFAFDEAFIKRAFNDYKSAEEKLGIMFEELKPLKGQWTDVQKKNFNEAELNYEREKSRYYHIIELNLAVLNGKKKIDDAHNEYNDNIFKKDPWGKIDRKK